MGLPIFGGENLGKSEPMMRTNEFKIRVGKTTNSWFEPPSTTGLCAALYKFTSDRSDRFS